jgi:hypothetical protein
MNRIKDYAAFVGWFAGLGYIVLWPITAGDLGGKPFGASIFCQDGASSLTDFLCNSAHPLQLPPGLHALGFLSALFVTARLLTHVIRRMRRAAGKGAGNAATAGAASTVKIPATIAPPPRKPTPARRAVKPRTQFGLRGLRR